MFSSNYSLHINCVVEFSTELPALCLAHYCARVHCIRTTCNIVSPKELGNNCNARFVVLRCTCLLSHWFWVCCRDLSCRGSTTECAWLSVSSHRSIFLASSFQLVWCALKIMLILRVPLNTRLHSLWQCTSMVRSSYCSWLTARTASLTGMLCVNA